MPTDERAILADAWARLRAGQADARHAFRTAALATADAVGRPDVRTVVLRHVDEPNRTIDFQTDRRSPKWAGLSHNASAAWLFYDRTEQVQLRIASSVVLHSCDPTSDGQWQRVPDPARGPYRQAVAPGGDLDADAPPLPHDGRVNFCVGRCRVESLEWLKLDGGTWRRLRFTWPGGGPEWRWLTP